MNRILLAATASFALSLSVPLQAEAHSEQDAAQAELEQAMAALGEMFPTEPLTPEQEARLPLAERIVAQMIPEGTMGEIFSSVFDEMLQPMMQMGGDPSALTVSKGIGVTPFELEREAEQAQDIAALFDPAWDVRQERELAVFPQVMAEMMTLMEPGIRKAMSELYAIRFDDQELIDIEAFFSTDTGTKYARESFVMASDPRMMGASMDALPLIMNSMADLEAKMAEAVEGLPPVRSYDELSDEERAKVIAATGFTDEEIRLNLSTDYSSEEAEWAVEEAVKDAAEAEIE